MQIVVTDKKLLLTEPISDADPTINGPTCITVPDWCTEKLGKYYLYFSSHAGKSIYLAAADNVEGPWKIISKQLIDIGLCKDAYDHIASPDIYIDDHARKIYLFFHARSRHRGREQWTFGAESADGLRFDNISDRPLAAFYFRYFNIGGTHCGLSKGGNLWVSASILSPYRCIGNIFDRSLDNEYWHNDLGSIRHLCVLRTSRDFFVFYSRIGDRPERILATRFKLPCKPEDLLDFASGNLLEISRPEQNWEGAGIPLTSSLPGAATDVENALRDPYVFTEIDEQYLFYTVKGEFGIAVSKLRILD